MFHLFVRELNIKSAYVLLMLSFLIVRFEIRLDKENPAVPFRDLITTAKDGIYLYFRTL